MTGLNLRCFALLFAVGLLHAAEYNPSEAAAHLNEFATIVGTVAQASERKGHVFLNFERPYPQHTFTAFVPAKSVTAVGGVPFLTSLQGKTVAITGKIIDYKGQREIVVTSKEQIAVR